MALVEVEGQQLVEGEGLAAQGAGGVGKVLVLQGQVTAQVVPTQAFLWTQVAVVDGVNLEGVVGGEVELEAVVVLQLGDGAGAGGQRALEEPRMDHMLVVEVAQPQRLLAHQDDTDQEEI